MSEHDSVDQPDEPGADVSHRTLFVLEWLDSMAHVVVAGFFLILSTSVLIAAAFMFVKDVILFVHDSNRDAAGEFVHTTLELLSTLLFAVIILELLRTIITYLQTRDTQAIMKEFLIVGIISSVRKVLMVGAESSIADKSAGETSNAVTAIGANAFVQESIGVVLSVIAILLMIGGLILLRKYYGPGQSNE